jgi:hypothetical protein
MLQNIMIDIAPLRPDARRPVESMLVKGNIPDWLDKKAGNVMALLSPRLWDELPKTYRERPDVVGVRYRFDSQALEFLGQKFGWQKTAQPYGGTAAKTSAPKYS